MVRKRKVDADLLVAPERQEAILAAAAKTGGERLTPIKEALGGDYTWLEIKAALAARRR